jgi:hypothetical protein
MKVLKFFAFVGIFAMMFASCKKEDEFTIVGKWNVDKVTTTVFINGNQFGDPDIDTNDGWIQFNSDKTGVTDDGETFTWSLSGDNLTITWNDPDEDQIPSLLLVLKTKEAKRVVAEGEFTMEDDWEGQTIILTVKMVIELSKI